MSEKAKRQKSDHTYKIKGNVIELHSIGLLHGLKHDNLRRRYFVSPEFVQLFYKLLDGEFDEMLYERLPDKEKHELAHVINFLGMDTKEFNIALSKLTLRMQWM